MTETSRFLFSGDCLKQGILFKYAVPIELINANIGREIVFNLYANGTKLKTIPIKSAGNHYAIIEPSSSVSSNIVDEIEFKLNASYTNEQFDFDTDDKRKGIFINYFGNVDQTHVATKQTIEMVSPNENKFIEVIVPGAQDSFGLTKFDKREWFYPSNIIDGKDICIIYGKNKNPNRSLKLQVEINGRKRIIDIENSKFGENTAVVIPFSTFNLPRKITVMNLKLLNANEDDGIFINYVGPSVLQQNIIADRFSPIATYSENKHELQKILKRTTGLYYDNEVKAFQMVKKVDILLDNKYMENKNLEIDFSIPEGLQEYFEGKDKNLEICLDNKPIMTVPLQQGKQKITINKSWWNCNLPVSKLTLKSSLYDLPKRVHLPRALRGRGLEFQFIGVER